MKHFILPRILIVFAGVFVFQGLAWGQSAPSPRQLQGMIAQGQDQAALNALNVVLQAHSDSGVAWYLTAEAQNGLGHEDAARGALAKAEQVAPGLPFAKPDDVTALQAHLNNGAGGEPARHGGFGSMIFILGGFVVLFLLVRMMLRSRRRVMPAYDAYGRPMAGGPGGYGPAGGYAPPGYGGGSGVGGSLIGGLVAGAGFAAGERIIDDFEGNRDQNNGGAAPDQDDGLQGNPGWDDNSGGNDGGGFDPNNSW